MSDATTAESILNLISGGETLATEFKSDRGLNDSELLEAIVCLANKRGGSLLIGVEDDGKVTGLQEPHSGSTPPALAAYIANHTRPSLIVEVEFIVLSDVKVAVIQVPASPQIIATHRGRVLQRSIDAYGKPYCRTLFPTDYDSWYADRGQRDITARVIAGATWNDFDPIEFERLQRLLQTYRGDSSLYNLSDQELASALGFVVGEKLTPTLAGLLVVGRESAIRLHIPTHEVAFQTFRGQAVAINEFYRSPLLRIFERITEAFSVRNEEQEITVGLFRVGIPSYDPQAFREAVNNALTHRDYARLGATYIQIHDDEIIIRNPGTFMEGIRLDALLRSGPRPRNPLLADIFKRIGLVERTGRGIGLIFTGMLRNGRTPPDYSQTTDVQVTVQLSGGPIDTKFVQAILQEERRRNGNPLSLNELLLLYNFYHLRELTNEEASAIIQRDELATRRILESLVDNGLLERRGGARGRTYILSGSVYRQLGRTAEYIRRRGFTDQIQQEQMIRDYINQKGTITRREIMELCQLTVNQAKYLLQRLLARNVVEFDPDALTIGGGVRYILYGSKGQEILPNVEDGEMENGEVLPSSISPSSIQERMDLT